MTLLNIPGLLLWLVLIPLCIGLLPMQWIPREQRRGGVVLIAGYLIMLPLCWLVAVPCILFVKYYSFIPMVRIYTVVVLAAAALGVFLAVRAQRRGRPILQGISFSIRRLSWEERIGWLVFLGLVGLQLYKSFTLASFDGDDAEYVAQSLVTEESDTMYLIRPYTGGTTALDIRHSLAVLPVWIAYIGRMTGVHTTILSHSVLPFLLIPLTYLVYGGIGRHLLKKKKKYLPGFMALMALLQIFGNVSIYTGETFFLTRTWQGKAVAVSFVIPMTILLLLWIFDREEGEKESPAMGLWMLLCLANMTAGVCTSMSVFLNAVMIGTAAFWMMAADRKFSILVKAGAACIPNAVYMLLYLFLRTGV